MNLQLLKADIIFVVTAIGSVLSYILGGFDTLLITLISFSVFDYLTGVLNAIYHKKLNSDVGYRGIIKKLGIYILVAIGQLLQSSIGIPALREIIIMFFISNEGISILENLTLLGLPLPEKLKDILYEISAEYQNKKNENKESEEISDEKRD